MQSSARPIARRQHNLSSLLWTKLANPQNLLEPLTRAQIPADLLPKLIASLGDALWYAFLDRLRADDHSVLQ